jgi:hypothetical protein
MIFFMSLILQITASFADGGGLFELAKAHQAIFVQCFSQATYGPQPSEDEWQDISAEDRPFLYVLEHSMLKTYADVHFGGHDHHVTCREWIPYLSRIYFEDGKDQDSLMTNFEARFRKEKGL